MKDALNSLNEWLNELTSFSLPKWKNLPDLDLYMDQVVTYLERELEPLSVDNKEKMITSSMVNNYVKGGLVNNPNQKKYSKEHLAYLLAICSIKQILTISEISSLFEFQKNNERQSNVIYEFFRTTQTEMIKSIANDSISKLVPILERGHELTDDDASCFLHNFVFKLAIEAEVKKIIANKMLSLISNSSIDLKEKQEIEKFEREKQNNKKKKS
ncbi:MAG: DUF1836 domain-containing protein [Bacilli bacterium]